MTQQSETGQITKKRNWQLPAILGAGLLAAAVTAGIAAMAPAETGATGATPAKAEFHAGGLHAPAGAPSDTAADKAVQFQALLGQHSVLASNVMRSRIRGDDDFVQAANSALGKNTDAMVTMVSSLFGDAAGQQFGPMWSQHIVQLVNYAGALGDEDTDAQKNARDQLVKDEVALSGFFSGASQGRLPGDAAQGAVKMHVDHLTQQADAYAAGDYAKADTLNRTGFQHTYDLGGTLAATLLPPADAAVLQQPLWRLRSQLGKLLAEHAVLVEDVTRAAVANTPDFAAAGSMINLNTQDLAAAIDTLFGADAAKQFQDLWAAHVEQLVAYGSATAGKDAAKQAAAKTRLAEFEKQMATFLGAATGNKLSDADLADALSAHDTLLLRHADAYAAKDYPTAHNLAYETYDHMFVLARTLADAFGENVAKRLPTGGAQTGFGGLADTVGDR